MHDVEVGKDVVERILARRGRFHLYEEIAPQKAAFVVIDMQKTVMTFKSWDHPRC